MSALHWLTSIEKSNDSTELGKIDNSPLECHKREVFFRLLPKKNERMPARHRQNEERQQNARHFFECITQLQGLEDEPEEVIHWCPHGHSYHCA